MTGLRHYLRVLEALVLLGLARGLRRWVPMRRWARILGPTGPVTPTTADPAQPPEPSLTEWQVCGAIERATARLDANCLEQAVAGSLMLRARRQPASVVIGLDAADPGAVPHAWLVGRSGAVVLGRDETGRYRPVSQFGRPPAH